MRRDSNSSPLWQQCVAATETNMGELLMPVCTVTDATAGRFLTLSFSVRRSKPVHSCRFRFGDMTREILG
jgi:hypothetical protein